MKMQLITAVDRIGDEYVFEFPEDDMDFQRAMREKMGDEYDAWLQTIGAHVIEAAKREEHIHFHGSTADMRFVWKGHVPILEKAIAGAAKREAEAESFLEQLRQALGQ